MSLKNSDFWSHKYICLTYRKSNDKKLSSHIAGNLKYHILRIIHLKVIEFFFPIFLMANILTRNSSDISQGKTKCIISKQAIYIIKPSGILCLSLILKKINL